VKGELQKSKKQISVRGLNRDCNHDLKNLFKSAAIIASVKPGPFHMARKFRTDPAQSCGLGSKKKSGRCRSVFS
jgi:hypothetical protein